MKNRGYEWKFYFRTADGGKAFTQTYSFPEEVTEEYALSFTTQWVRDNLIFVSVFEKDHHYL